MISDLRHKKEWSFTLLLAAWLAVIGPAQFPARAATQGRSSGDAYGRTYYLDGAGNWGFGVQEVSEGLRRAGYQGRVITYHWSPTLNPALDQTVGRPFAKAKGKKLGEEITEYCRRFPSAQVNVIALSAGTGVATWACEAIRAPGKVHNLILLGSSLSSTYDMSDAIENIEGGVYVYYSRGDAILQGPVRTLGTIDGKLGVSAAGLVGLHPKRGDSPRIHNIAWSAEYRRYGWTGTHTDGTSEPFVENILSQHILPQKDQRPLQSVVASTRPSDERRAASGAKVRQTQFTSNRVLLMNNN